MDGGPAFRFQIKVIGDVVNKGDNSRGYREPLMDYVKVRRVLVVGYTAQKGTYTTTETKMSNDWQCLSASGQFPWHQVPEVQDGSDVHHVEGEDFQEFAEEKQGRIRYTY